MLVAKKLILPTRLRQIPRQFGWVDTRLLTAGLIERCEVTTLALYLFLIVVGDAQGLSYYSDRTVLKQLSLEGSALQKARAQLLALGLIAYESPLYQVLSLDEPQMAKRLGGTPAALGQILNMALQRAGQHD